MYEDDELSPDDILEEARKTTPPLVGKEHLPEDGDTPASPASDIPGQDLPIDHQNLDSDIDSDEAYHEGLPRLQ